MLEFLKKFLIESISIFYPDFKNSHQLYQYQLLHILNLFKHFWMTNNFETFINYIKIKFKNENFNTWIAHFTGLKFSEKINFLRDFIVFRVM